MKRKFLKKILGIHSPKTISNNKIYENSERRPWRETIKRRDLRWLGHLLRLNHQTPARTVLNEYIKKGESPIGRLKI